MYWPKSQNLSSRSLSLDWDFKSSSRDLIKHAGKHNTKTPRPVKGVEDFINRPEALIRKPYEGLSGSVYGG